jgi:hypothetical protein
MKECRRGFDESSLPDYRRLGRHAYVGIVKKDPGSLYLAYGRGGLFVEAVPRPIYRQRQNARQVSALLFPDFRHQHTDQPHFLLYSVKIIQAEISKAS